MTTVDVRAILGYQTSRSPVCGCCGEKIPLRSTLACTACGQPTHRLCGRTLDLGGENRPFICDLCAWNLARGSRG